MPLDLGLRKRANSPYWQWHFPIPKELQAAFNGQRQLRRSLGTENRREAEQKAAKLCAQATERFALEWRKANPVSVSELTPELCDLLADRVYHQVLALDDAVRHNPTTAGVLHSVLALQYNAWVPGVEPTPQPVHVPPGVMPGPDHSPFMGATSGQLHINSTYHRDTLAMYRSALAADSLVAALPKAKAAAQDLGLAIDWNSAVMASQVRRCLRKVLEALVQAHAGLVARDTGEVIATPAVPERQEIRSPERPAKLRDVLSAWKKADPDRHPKTVRDTELALALFEELTGDPPLSELTKPMGDDLRAKLLERYPKAKTAANKLNDINKLLTYAAEHRGLMERNPWAHLKIKHSKGTTKPWSADDIKLIFGSAIFTAYKLPSAVKAGRDAAYWVPLLVLYTGARVSELAQLRTQDVRVANCATTRERVHIIDITSEEDDEETGALATRTKTEASVRHVPIHDELIRLGFLDYAEDMRKAGHAQLFPHVKHGEGAGDQLSTWFGTYRRKVGVMGERRGLHQGRHTVRTALADAGATDTQSFAIGGWVRHGSSQGNAVYLHVDGLSPAKLREVVNRITYPYLSLPRVYPTRKI